MDFTSIGRMIPQGFISKCNRTAWRLLKDNIRRDKLIDQLQWSQKRLTLLEEVNDRLAGTVREHQARATQMADIFDNLLGEIQYLETAYFSSKDLDEDLRQQLLEDGKRRLQNISNQLPSAMANVSVLNAEQTAEDDRCLDVKPSLSDTGASAGNSIPDFSGLGGEEEVEAKGDCPLTHSR